MATPYQKPGKTGKDDPWYVRFADEHGERKNHTLKANGKTQAKMDAAALERQTYLIRKGIAEGHRQDEFSKMELSGLLNWSIDRVIEAADTRAKAKGKNRLTPEAVRDLKYAQHKIRRVLELHVLTKPIASMNVLRVEPSHGEVLLDELLQEGLSAKSVNNIRGYLNVAFNESRRLGKLKIPNPIADVQMRFVERDELPSFLTVDEVPLVLAAVPERWRALFAVAMLAGLRLGELAALRIIDVDLTKHLVFVRRSWNKNTTKGKHGDAVRIHDQLLPYLERAIAASRSGLVFPAPDGQMISRDTSLCGVLQTAMKRAGIITGWQQHCSHGCKHVETAADCNPRWCPMDKRKLWAVPQTRPMRFHDMRHTYASVLIMQTGDLEYVRQSMRHKDVKVTTIYAHLAPDFMKRQLDKVTFGLDVKKEAVATGFGEKWQLGANRPEKGSDPGSAAPSENDSLLGGYAGSGGGFRTPDPAVNSRLAGTAHPYQSVSESVKTAAKSTFSPGQFDTSRQAISAVGKKSGNWVPTGIGRPLRVYEGGKGGPLGVSDVAARLGVSTATVYKLCNRGDLAHYRVFNSIRVTEADLAGYVASQRREVKP